MLLRLMALDTLALVASVMVPLGILLRAGDTATRLAPPLPGPALDAAAWSSITAGEVRRSRIAGALATGCVVFLLALHWLPLNITDWYLWSFLVPVVTTNLWLAALFLRPRATPVLPAGATRPLDLSPRTIWSFGQRWWFVGWLAVIVLLVGTVITAGLISSPDENGNRTVLTISVGSVSASSSFLGWFYGVPLLLGVTGLIVLTVLALRATAQPPLAAAPDARALDVLLRRVRTRSILALSAGAAFVTLGLAWKLLGLAARMRAGGLTDTLGQVDVGTTFAAFATPFWAAGYLAEGLGIALLLSTLFARTPRFAAADPIVTPARGAVTSDTSA